jgi:hypothetical protein
VTSDQEASPTPERYGFDVLPQPPGFWTRVLQVLGILVILAGIAGAVQGATYTSEANATGTNFFGHSAVEAQLAAALVFKQCGNQSGDLKGFEVTTPPFTMSNVVDGPAMAAPGAQASGLVSCLTQKTEHLGYGVSKCALAATSVGIVAGRLSAYGTAWVMCRVTNGGSS